MSTRSHIGVQNEDNTVTYIYCHFDGYPGHHGPILKGHYETEEKARSLLALGDLSSLAERVAPSEGERHSYSSPVSDITVAYHRDRGEELSLAWVRPEMPDDKHAYLFTGGRWTHRAPRSSEWSDL